MSGVITNLSVSQIQQGIVRAVGGQGVTAIPNVSFGFFTRKGIECDLLVEYDYGKLHEFEIKRSWSDFLADFKKPNFHNDERLMKLTFVLPKALAGEKLKAWCAENYKTFRRTFDFWFYDEYARVFKPNMFDNGGKFSRDYYLTPEMRDDINSRDPVLMFRRGMFAEERANLFRLGCIRLWSNPPTDRLPEVPQGLRVIPFLDDHGGKTEDEV